MTPVTMENGRWVVTSTSIDGRTQRFECASEPMARTLARTFERAHGTRAGASQRPAPRRA
jgi:hypothetical protein